MFPLDGYKYDLAGSTTLLQTWDFNTAKNRTPFDAVSRFRVKVQKSLVYDK